MKKLLICCMAALFLSFVASDVPLSKKERKFALNLLKDTQKELKKSVEGLSAAQLAFKPSEEQWSVEGCLKHIAASEQGLGGMVMEALKQPANPEKRANIKASDEDVVNNLKNRTNKVKTMESMQPENTPFASAAEAQASYAESRGKLIEFIQSTQDDMRNHVMELPFGSYDSYQVVLLIGAHTNRHMQQIEEVKSHPDFPKN